MKIIYAKKDDQIWQLSNDDVITIKVALKNRKDGFSMELLRRIRKQEKIKP